MFRFDISNEPVKNFWKTITFQYVIDTKNVLLEPSYFFSKGRFYWPVLETSRDSLSEMVDFCFSSFEKMDPENLNETVEKTDWLTFFNVKTWTGAVRKVEQFEYCWTDLEKSLEKLLKKKILV